MEPYYIIWHPTLSQTKSKKIIFLNITTAGAFKLPADPLDYYDMILKEVGIVDNKAKNVEIIETRSTYNNLGNDAEDWRDVWPLNWLVFIELEKDIERYEMNEEFFESFADVEDYSNNWLGGESPIGCLFIFDFEDQDSMNNSISEIEAIKNTNIEIYTKNIGNFIFQVQFLLGQFEESFFYKEQKEMLMIREIIQKYGGYENYDIRVEKIGELD